MYPNHEHFNLTVVYVSIRELKQPSTKTIIHQKKKKKRRMHWMELDFESSEAQIKIRFINLDNIQIK